MSDKRRKLINECVEALERINKQNGFATISRQTLNTIVAQYIAKNGSPELPGTWLSPGVFQRDSIPKPPVIENKPKNVINIFSGETDFKSIQQMNKENDERIRRERLKSNNDVLGPKARK